MNSRPSLPRKPSDYNPQDASNPNPNPTTSTSPHQMYPQDAFYSPNYDTQQQQQSHSSNYTSAADYYRYDQQQSQAADERPIGGQSSHSYDHLSKPNHVQNLSPNLQSNEQQRPVSLNGIISMYANSNSDDQLYESQHSDSSPSLHDNGYQHHPATFPQPRVNHYNTPSSLDHHQRVESTASLSGRAGGRTSRPLPPPPPSTSVQQQDHTQGPSPSYYQNSSYQFPPESNVNNISTSHSGSLNLGGAVTTPNESFSQDYYRTPESTFSNSNSRIQNDYDHNVGHTAKQNSNGSSGNSNFGLPPTTPSSSAIRTSGGGPAWSPALSSSSLPHHNHASSISSSISRPNPSPSPSRILDGLPERNGGWNGDQDQSEILGEDDRNRLSGSGVARPSYGRTSSSSSINRRRNEGIEHHQHHQTTSTKNPSYSSNRPPVPLIIPPVQDHHQQQHQTGPLSPRTQQPNGGDYSTPPGRGDWSRDPSPRPDQSTNLSRRPSRGNGDGNTTPTIASDGIERDQYGYPIDRKSPRYVDVHSRTDSVGNQSAGLLSPTMSPTSRTFSNSSANYNSTSTSYYNPISQIPPAPSSSHNNSYVRQDGNQNGSTPIEYVDFSLLSNLAVLLRDAVPRGEQIKGSIAYPGSFTGRDVVSTLQTLIPKELAADSMGIGNDLRSGNLKNWDDGIGSEQNNRSRRVALLVAKTLKKQLFFHEVDWGEGELNDGVEDVYMFLGDTLGGDEVSQRERNNFNHQVNNNVGGGYGSPQNQRKSLKSNYNNNNNSDPFSDDWTSPLESNGPLDLGLILPSNHHNNTSNSASDLDELPTGVFTPLTNCYSPLCGKPNSPFECYSSSCPRSKISPLKRHISSASNSVSNSNLSGASGPSLSASNSFNNGNGATTTTHNESRMNSRAWVELVPKELLSSLPKREIDRQNAIHETIQKEEEYLADVELLEDLFVQGLLKPNEAGDPPPIAIGPARDHFIAEVFSNHRLLASHIRRLVERLHVRQREEHPIIQSIGDIFLDAALEWAEVYEANMINFPLAKSRVRREMQVNPRFAEFVETCRRHPSAHRHELDNFLYRPTARLQRYHLHFEAILKKTEENNNDKESLTRAMEVIDHQCKTSQIGVASSEIKVKIREYAWGLTNKRNKAAIDMDLLHPERQLVHQGRVLRKPDFTDFEWTDLLAVLFDNYLIVVKPKKVEQGDRTSPRYILAKRPIPVEMMELSGFNDASVSRSIGLSNFHIRERDNRDLWPFTVQHIGGKMEPLTLFSVSKEDREEWKKKLNEAIGLRSAVQEANKVFESHILSDNIFALPSASSIDPDKPPQGVDSSVFHGKVTCAVPFSTADNRRLVAIGCSDGVWIGLRHDPKSLRKVLHLKLVSQCAVLEPFGIFVVLADKVLISYSLEALVPSSNPNGLSGSSASTPRPPQKLSGNRDVVFFSVGVLKERTLLVYMKRRANECVFRALEPVMNAPRADQGKSGGGFFGKFGKDSKNPDWFRIYKTFFIPSEAYTMQFLRSKLCIVCARGFEIMNLDSLLPGTIPDFSHCPRDDPRIQAIAKRVETAKPLGMFKSSESEFLLCYNDFACYVDRVGEPIRLDNVIEWEGEPHSVAFQAPYVLAFDSRFVEVRDSASGRLVQIIRGSDMRYISGSSTVTSSQASRTDGESVYSPEGVQDGTIIITQRKKANGRTPFDYQSVVELVSNAPQIIQANHNTTLAHTNTMSSRQGWI